MPRGDFWSKNRWLYLGQRGSHPLLTQRRSSDGSEEIGNCNGIRRVTRASGTAMIWTSMRMELPYEHVQVGWVILSSLLLPVAILAMVASAVSSNVPLLVAAGFLVLLAALFGTLRVRVDASALSIRFGIGIIRRRFALSDLRSFAEVENPWYYGWGIRLYPGGTLYNVSGLGAVELALRDGGRVRVGTDESAKLYLVLESILGAPAPLSELPASPPKGGSARIRLIALAGVGTLLLFLPFLLHFQARPPVITLTPKFLKVDNLFYGQSYNLSEITRVELLQSLPAVRIRTNGYAAGGTLRGWFNLDRLGQGKLFVEAAHPPYVAIFFQSSFVIINYAEREDTQQLYRSIRQAVDRSTDLEQR